MRQSRCNFLSNSPVQRIFEGISSILWPIRRRISHLMTKYARDGADRAERLCRCGIAEMLQLQIRLAIE
ncbi:hypothetical protein SCH4B_0758 [Ruegeria sp. TrichCH4B]|nr:hypothetical protein SCH4B_0758 [Ruegeria sp. TrichCH4B]